MELKSGQVCQIAAQMCPRGPGTTSMIINAMRARLKHMQNSLKEQLLPGNDAIITRAVGMRPGDSTEPPRLSLLGNDANVSFDVLI